ncbi:MAG: CHASE2 domain-containing protein, partial [Pseudomonadota bacterium]
VIETPADCISVSRFLEMSVDELRSQVENKIVLIGTTANGYDDLWRTPYTKVASVDRQVPGVFQRVALGWFSQSCV